MLPRIHLAVGIVLTILLIAVQMVGGYALNVDLDVPVRAVFAVLLGVDCARASLGSFQTVFAYGPFATAVMTALAWPVVLPWYLHIQRRATLGTLPPREAHQRRAPAPLIVVVLLGGLFSAAPHLPAVLFPKTVGALTSVSAEVAGAVELETRASWSDGNLTLLLLNPTDPTPDVLEKTARRVANLGARRSINGRTPFYVIVAIDRIGTRGGVSITEHLLRRQWASAHLLADSMAATFP
jgi:hypothetical protein